MNYWEIYKSLIFDNFEALRHLTAIAKNMWRRPFSAHAKKVNF